MPGPLVLLGPQTPVATLRPALDRLARGGAARGRVVVISAGRRLDEASDAELRQEIDPQAVSLPLYAAFERVAAADPELATAYKERQLRLRRFKAYYRIRLHPALAVVRRLLTRLADEPDLCRPVLDAAVAHVREIDGHFLAHSDAVHMAFEANMTPHHRPAVQAVRARAAELLAEARAVVIAGGHVGVLLNRLEFFGMDEMFAEAHARGVPIVGWSAGAMVLADRVVLFHDDPPHGTGEPELLDRGLGLIPDLLLFPQASQRLRLDEQSRVASLALRFSPARCVGLDSGAWIEPSALGWRNRGGAGTAFFFTPLGQVQPLEEASDA